MDDIKVTVYCPAYNHESYIRSALDGFVMQKTNFQFEVLVHDDASTDRTADIIREYELKYPDIIKAIYQKENLYRRKINRTYAYLLDKTRGKYIAFCEGDDYWNDPYKLQKQYDYMEAHPECSAVVHEAETLRVDTMTFSAYTKYDFEENGYDFDFTKLIENLSSFPTASLFFKKEFYTKHEAFLKSVSVYDYVIKLLLASDGTVHVLKGVMSVYRLGSVGSWTVRIARSQNNYITHLKKAIDILNQIDAYTDYKYHDSVKQEIHIREFNIHCISADMREIKSPVFLNDYKKLSPKNKLILHIKCCFPRLYNVLIRVTKNIHR